MKKEVFVTDLKSKQDLESLFLVKFSAVQESRDGKKYLNAILSDASGDLECKKWQGADEAIKTLERGNYVKVKGKVNQYQGRNQLILNWAKVISDEDIKKHNGENWKDLFITKAAEDADKMFDQLCALIDSLDDVYIRDLIKSIIYEPEVSRRLKLWPAGKTIHHAYQSGLLEHLLSCITLGIHLSKHYKVNTSYVAAGCLLHDLCKIFELTDGDIVEYTEEGKLIGHLVKIIEVIDFHAAKIKNFPRDVKMHLKHIMLSHHGEYAYGSPKIPQTSEAMLVHLVDLMDSRMSSFETIKKMDKQTGHWSSYVKHLDRIVYKESLPTFTSYIKEDTSKKPYQKTSSELKHSLGDALKDIKIGD